MPAVGGGIPAEEEDPEETPPPPEGVMADKAIDKGVVGDVTVGVVAKDGQVNSLTQLCTLPMTSPVFQYLSYEYPSYFCTSFRITVCK